jgi:hypothetical protein
MLIVSQKVSLTIRLGALSNKLTDDGGMGGAQESIPRNLFLGLESIPGLGIYSRSLESIPGLGIYSRSLESIPGFGIDSWDWNRFLGLESIPGRNS